MNTIRSRKKTIVLVLFLTSIVGALQSTKSEEALEKHQSSELKFGDRVLEWFQIDNTPQNVTTSIFSGKTKPGDLPYNAIMLRFKLKDPTGQSTLNSTLTITMTRFESRDDAALDSEYMNRAVPIIPLDFRDSRGWGRLTGSSDGRMMFGYWKEFSINANLGINRPYELVGIERFGWAAGLADVLLYCLREAVEPGLAPELPGSPGVLWKEPGEMGYMDGPFSNDPSITWRPFLDEGYAENFISQGREVKRVDMDLVRRLSGEGPTWSWQKGWWIGAGLLILLILAVRFLKRTPLTQSGDNGSAT